MKLDVANQDGGSSIQAYESRKSHRKIGDCEQSISVFVVAAAFVLICYFRIRGCLFVCFICFSNNPMMSQLSCLGTSCMPITSVLMAYCGRNVCLF